ncbi:MAG: hypothetical protein P8P46_03175, partial [Alphaproteobacteria bacterium]|nr:hypothetical protein [Alphaproteobacteria bacterium]
MISFSKKRYSKITTILSSFYAVSLLILALGYSFLSDSGVYKISPELSAPKPTIIEEPSRGTSPNVSNNFKLKADKIELRLNDPNFLIQGKKIYRTNLKIVKTTLGVSVLDMAGLVLEQHWTTWVKVII